MKILVHIKQAKPLKEIIFSQHYANVQLHHMQQIICMNLRRLT